MHGPTESWRIQLLVGPCVKASFQSGRPKSGVIKPGRDLEWLIRECGLNYNRYCLYVRQATKPNVGRSYNPQRNHDYV
jgi:hypothetical protein